MRFFRRNSYRTLWLVLLCMTTFFVGNGSFPTNQQEAEILVSAREMVNDGNWLFPTMNGDDAIERPPLAIWVAAAIEKISPGNVSFHRTAAGIMGLVWALAFFGTARCLYRRKYFAEIATVIFLTCYNVIYMGRMVDREIYGYALMQAAIYFITRLMYDDRYYDHPHKWRWAALAGLMVGLAGLGNGNVPFYAMLLPYLFAVIIFRKPQMKGKWLPAGLTILLMLVVGGWWYVYLWVNYPSAFSAVARSEINSWLSPSKYPWFYYWRFFAEMGVWSIIVLVALLVPYWKKRLVVKRQYYITVTWLLLALVLLSVMPNKGMIRLLPLVPPGALAVALILSYYQENRPADTFGKFVYNLNGFALALLVFLLPFIIHVRIVNWGLADFGTALFVIMLVVAILISIVISLIRYETVRVVWGVGALFMVLECLMIGPIANVFVNSHKLSISYVHNVDELKNLLFYHDANDTVRAEVVYAIDRRILSLDLKDDKAVANALPCVVLTHQPIADVLSPQLLQRIDTTKIGIFDDNNMPRRSRLHTTKLIYQVSVLRTKR